MGLKLDRIAAFSRASTNLTDIECRISLTGEDAKHSPLPNLKATMLLSGGAACRIPHDNTTVPPACMTSLGLIVGRNITTKDPFVLTFAGLNRQRYWPSMYAISPPAQSPTRFPIVDSFRGDDDVTGTLDAIHAMSRMGYHGLQVQLSTETIDAALHSTGQDTVHPSSAKLSVPCSHTIPTVDPETNRSAIAKPASCAFRPWLRQNDTDHDLANASSLTSWAAELTASWKSLGYKPGSVGPGPMHDEPGWTWEMPPVETSTVIRKKWEDYLRSQKLTPTDLGSERWDSVVPIGREDARQRIKALAAADGDWSSSTADALALRKLYYWSARYNAWEPTMFFADATKALEAGFGGPVHMYTNWNK